METKVSCCGDVFGYAKVSAIVELSLSVIANTGLLVGFIYDVFIYNFGLIVQLGIYKLFFISTNTILVIFELKNICRKSIKKWNLVMRIIWTLVVGLIVTLYLIQLITCTHHGRNACLIWDRWGIYVGIFSICLLIVGPMFLYGIFKSFLLHKVLKAQSELTQQLP